MSPYRVLPIVPDVLVCAGLDPSGGAGLIADVRVLSEHGCRPVGVITALTIQNTTGVVGTQALDPEHLGDQLQFLLSDIEVKAVKLGMIGSSQIGRSISRALDLTNAPVVWDPIMYPSRGDVALGDSMFGESVAILRSHVTVVTPNARELAILSRKPIDSLADALAAGTALAHQLGVAVLVKGGHLGGDESIDVLIHRGGSETMRAARVPEGHHVHGTGCALASAIAAHLAHGRDLVDACRSAKEYVAARIANPARPGRGAPAVV